MYNSCHMCPQYYLTCCSWHIHTAPAIIICTNACLRKKEKVVLWQEATELEIYFRVWTWDTVWVLFTLWTSVLPTHIHTYLPWLRLDPCTTSSILTTHSRYKPLERSVLANSCPDTEYYRVACLGFLSLLLPSYTYTTALGMYVRQSL